MTVLHTGSTKKFSAHWGDIFSKAGGGKTLSLKKAEPAKKPKAKAAQPKVGKAKPAPATAAKATAAKKAKSKK